MSFAAQTYFDAFQLPKGFAIDLGQLNQAYRTLQAQWHPDRFAAADESERQHAVQYSSWLNDAYETLKSPLKRASYLLELNGLDVTRMAPGELPQADLLAHMEWREQLEAIPRTEAGLASLSVLRSTVKGRAEDRWATFADAVADGRWVAAKSVFHDLQYFTKLLADMDEVEARVLDD